MLLLERDFQIPESPKKKAYLLDRKLSPEQVRGAVADAMKERASGTAVNVLVMKKNKKFQKQQLEEEGYTDIVEVFA